MASLTQEQGLAQGLLSTLLVFHALTVASATFIEEDFDLESLRNSSSILKALLKGKDCVENYTPCPSQLAVIGDPTNAACFYICSGKGGACRACCDPGYIFVAPSLQAPFGSCSKL